MSDPVQGRVQDSLQDPVDAERPDAVLLALEKESRAAVDTQQLFSSRIELAHLRKPRVRIRPRPLDLRPPVSRLVQPPRLSLRVPSCVVCRGQSHGRSGSRIAIFITARGSGATRARRLDRQCRQCCRCHHRLRDARCVLFVVRLI